MQRQLQLQEQVKLTAHQKKLVLENFHYTIESLEEYIEKTGYYPDFKDKKQIFKESINDASRTSAELADDFLTQLLCFKAIVDNKPEFFKEEIKEEFYKWINAVGINVKNCPNELRHYLFEINEILEGRGEKIVEQTRELIEGAEIDPRDLVKVVGVLQKPLNDNRERGKSLEGKTYRDIEIESKFNGDAKQGDITFNQMAWDFNHDYFDFFPELAKKKRQRAIDDYLEGERKEEEKENREAIKKRKITDEARKVEQQVQEQTEVEVNSEKLVQEQAEAEEKDKQHNSSEKTKNNLNNNLNQAQSSDATAEDRVQVIKDLGKIHGEEDFEEQQKQIEVIMDKLGRTNPPKLVEGLVGAIEENLRKNDLTIAELPTEIQEDYQNIKDNQDKVDKINETIGKTGAQKRFKKLKTELSKVAKFTQAQVKKLKEKLLRFICSKNKYEQAYQAEVRQLLKQLENYEQKQLNSENESLTVGVGRMASIIGGGLLAVGLIIGTWCKNWLK